MKACKKLLTAVAGVLFLVCMALSAVACGGKTFYKVTLDFNAEQGTVTVTAPKNEAGYEAGEEATVTVTAKSGYEVDAFTVNGTAQDLNGGSYTFEVEKDTSVKATFKATGSEEATYTVTVAGYNTACGKVELTPAADGNKYAKGAEVTVTVTANEGYAVESVKVNGEAVTLEENKYSFTVEGDTTIAVAFKEIDLENTYSVTVTQNEHGKITFTPAGENGRFEAGTLVAARIEPEEGYYVLNVRILYETEDGKVDEPVELTNNTFAFLADADKEIAIYYGVSLNTKWEGLGTEDSPYIIETLADTYDVKIPIIAPTEDSWDTYPYALDLVFTYTEVEGGVYTIRSNEKKNLRFTIYEGDTSVYSWSGENKMETFTLEANKTYTIIVGSDFTWTDYRNTPVDQIDERVSFEILEGDHTNDPLWSGSGTEQDPYVITTLEDDYEAPLEATTYFSYTATETATYSICIRDGVDAMIVIYHDDENILSLFRKSKTFTLESGETYLIEVEDSWSESDALYFTIEKMPDFGDTPVEKIPAAIQGTYYNEDDGDEFFDIGETTLTWGEKTVVVLQAYLTEITAKIDGEIWVFEFDDGDVTVHPWGDTNNMLYFTDEAPVVIEVPEELQGIWTSGEYTMTITGSEMTFAGGMFGSLPGEITAYDAATHTLTFDNFGMEVNGVFDPNEKTITVDLSLMGAGELVFTKSGSQSEVQLPEELKGDWKGTGTYADCTLTLQDGKLSIADGQLDGFEGELKAYDAATKTFTVDAYGMPTTLVYNEKGILTLDLSAMMMGKAIFTRDGNIPAFTLPAELEGTWTATNETGTHTLVFNDKNVSLSIFGTDMTGNVLFYDETAHTLNLSLTDEYGTPAAYDASYDAAKATIAITINMGYESMTFVFTKGGSQSEAQLPEEIAGVWTGTLDGKAWTLTIEGTTVTLNNDGLYFPYEGTINGYNAETKTINMTLDDSSATAVYDDSAKTLTVTYSAGRVSNLVLQKTGGDEDGFAVFQGVWTGTLNGGKYTLTIEGTTVSLHNGNYPLDGTLDEYNKETHVLSLTIWGDPYTATYDEESGKLTLNYDGNQIVFTKESGSVGPSAATEAYYGKWTGVAGEVNYEVTIEEGKISYLTSDDMGKIDDLTIEDYTFDETTGITATRRGYVYRFFLTAEGKLEVYFKMGSDAEKLLATLTKEGGSTAEKGSESDPIVWDTFAGEHSVSIAASQDAENTYVFFTFTVPTTGSFELEYPSSVSTMDILLYAEGSKNFPVAVWNTYAKRYAFTLNTSVKYFLRINNPANVAQEFNLTVKPYTLTEFPAVYRNTWKDIEETYTLVINENSIQINGGNAISIQNVTIVNRNGGYAFVWNGQNCSIMANDTSTGGKQIITFEIGETRTVLYLPNQAPSKEGDGSAENPYKLTEATLAKEYSYNTSVSGEYYHKITVTATTVFTVTSTSTYLFLEIESEEDGVIFHLTGTTEGKVFCLYAGKTYMMTANYSNENDESGMGGSISFKIEKGGTMPENSTIPEALRGHWSGEGQNELTLTETGMSVHLYKSSITILQTKSGVYEVKQTGENYEIVFSNDKYQAKYDAATKALTFEVYNEEGEHTDYVFHLNETSADAWQGTLPEAWAGTWKNGDVTITISGNEITIDWASAGYHNEKVTIVDYAMTGNPSYETCTITFVDSNGVRGTITGVTYDSVATPFLSISISVGGKSYSALRKS